MRKPKEKLYCCPKCSKKYSGQKWMTKHLAKSGHSSTWIIYYNSDTILQLNNRIQLLESKIDNLDFKNLTVESCNATLFNNFKKKITENPDLIPPEKKESKTQLTIVIQQLNIVFKTVNRNEEHNIKPSEILQTIKN